MNAIGKEEPYPDYRKAAGVNNTWLSQMQISALAMHAHEDLAPTKSLRLGRMNHTCSLEHDRFAESFKVWPGGMTRPKSGEPQPTQSKSSADYKEFKAEHEGNGIDVVDKVDVDLCNALRDRVFSHPLASKLLTGTRNELSIYWLHRFGVQMKSRIDVLGPSWIADLKFMREVTPRRMNRSITDYNYHSQAAMYRDAVHALTGEWLPYYIIAVEKTGPRDVVVYELDDEILGLGRRTYEGWLDRYVHCVESGLWPGISDTAIKAELPNWAYEDDLTRRIITAGMEIEPNE